MSDRIILWAKVWGVATTQGAITLSWVIYNLYFPILLVQFGFTKEFAITILIVENILESFVEPVFGAISDQQQQKIGSKIPLISVGIVLSSILFILLPVVAIFTTPSQVWRWSLPVLAVIWAFGMAIFRAPTMALLEETAPVDKLPQAASILTLVSEVVGTLSFIAHDFILGIGASFAFAIGSIALLIAGARLRWLNPPRMPQFAKEEIAEQEEEEEEEEEEGKSHYAKFILVCLAGISIAWSLHFLNPALQQFFTIQWGEDNTEIAMTLFDVGLGFAALVVGILATRLGNSWGVLFGCILTIVSSNLLIMGIFSQATIALTLCIIWGFSFVLNGVIPFVLELISSSQSGLGLGIYFGGLSAGTAFFDIVFEKLINLPLNWYETGANLCLLLIINLIIVGLTLD
ncbi:Major Facilitator Superfamily transporter [Xenococcus sp. PCC 7305]|uniref:MFS transporter n=1 Tax=Xenococcus sp. PCC 7305 TaxID=102125 RepID=UPI0002AC0990|nr:MFS transporter [Xenococcus sp. PCC 7305]ELS03009.1 Major Facilitator Superfamily transporter [Xenococcus sp. PCC 7305]